MIKELEFIFSNIWHFLGLLVIIHVVKSGLTGYQNSLTSTVKGFYRGLGKGFVSLVKKREKRIETKLNKRK